MWKTWGYSPDTSGFSNLYTLTASGTILLHAKLKLSLLEKSYSSLESIFSTWAHVVSSWVVFKLVFLSLFSSSCKKDFLPSCFLMFKIFRHDHLFERGSLFLYSCLNFLCVYLYVRVKPNVLCAMNWSLTLAKNVTTIKICMVGLN